MPEEIPKHTITYHNNHGFGENVIQFETKPGPELLERLRSNFTWSRRYHAWIADDHYVFPAVTAIIAGDSESASMIMAEDSLGMYD